MTEHYFSKEPSAKARPFEFTARLRGRDYTFSTDAAVFSRGELDVGSRLLIETLPCQPGDTVLDLGCGYGPIGMAAAGLVGSQGKVFLVDVNTRAVALAQRNIVRNKINNAVALVSDGLTGLPGVQFDWVVSNPPIRAGKAVFYPLLSDGYRALKPGGCLLVVIRTKQGAKSLERYLTALAGQDCQTIIIRAGFRILQCCKQSD